MSWGTTYDTGALLAAERNHRRMMTLHRRILERGVSPVVPAAVLAQAWRCGPQPNLSRMLAGCRIEPLSEPLARESGRLCGRAGTSDVVDAAVVAGAASRGDTIVTSDAGDLARLAHVAQRPVYLLTV